MFGSCLAKERQPHVLHVHNSRRLSATVLASVSATVIIFYEYDNLTCCFEDLFFSALCGTNTNEYDSLNNYVHS